MGEVEVDRRSLLIASFLMAGIAGCGANGRAGATPAHPLASPDPNETFVLPYDKIGFEA